MNDAELLLFYNTCGKVFTNRIVFASVIRETEINPIDIKDVQITSTISGQSMMFIVVPLPLFIMPFFLQASESGLKICITAIGLVLLLLAVFKAHREYHFKLYLKDGSVITWCFWRSNLSDAQKFAAFVKKLLRPHT